MSEDRQFDNDPERTLVTLEQLSRTIEIMTDVVNRLRRHLSEQLVGRQNAPEPPGQPQEENARETTEAETGQAAGDNNNTGPDAGPDSFVVEIRRQDQEHGIPPRKDSKRLH